jgi:outer membrane protein assembly factor BamB
MSLNLFTRHIERHFPPFGGSGVCTTVLAVGLVSCAAALTRGQVIEEDYQIFPADGATIDRFGGSIAVDNGIIAVGAFLDDDNGTDSGSAYLFRSNTGGGITKLLAADGAEFDQFGGTIALGGGVVAVGAASDDIFFLTNAGSVYLFDASTGTQFDRLIADDRSANDVFGSSLAIDEGVVAIGARLDDDLGDASGSAYLFDIATGNTLVKLLPTDGAAGDQFGHAIDIDGGIVVVGASHNNDQGDLSGSAYLFDAATGQQLRKLLPDDGAQFDRFGFAVAIDEGVVAVASIFDDDAGANAGSVYLFDAATGDQIAKIMAFDGAASHEFGNALSMDGGVLAVASRGDRVNGPQSGSAYLFDAVSGDLITKLIPSDGDFLDFFGQSIAIGQGIVSVGATGQADNGFESGSAYVLDINCGPDLSGDGVLDFFDILAFLQLFSSEDPAADWNGDHVFNFFDVSAYLSAFSDGCL